MSCLLITICETGGMFINSECYCKQDVMVKKERAFIILFIFVYLLYTLCHSKYIIRSESRAVNS